jgi:hypothetical protein
MCPWFGRQAAGKSWQNYAVVSHSDDPPQVVSVLRAPTPRDFRFAELCGGFGDETGPAGCGLAGYDSTRGRDILFFANQPPYEDYGEDQIAAGGKHSAPGAAALQP